MKRNTVILVILIGYVVMQFTWWTVYLVQLRNDVMRLELAMLTHPNQQQLVLTTYRTKLWMIAGEGMVFALILTAGAWYILRAHRQQKELELQKGNFLLTISHELRSPLSSVKLFVQGLIKRPEQIEANLRLAPQTLSEIHRLETLVDRILMTASFDGNEQPVEFEPVQVGELFRAVERTFQAHRDFARLQFNTDNQVYIRGHFQYLTLALSNLVDNALKYTADTPILVSCRQDNCTVTIAVADYGPGLSKTESERVFDRFYRGGNELRRQSAGTGLGLYLVKNIARMHGARVSLECRPGHGATFGLQFKQAAHV